MNPTKKIIVIVSVCCIAAGLVFVFAAVGLFELGYAKFGEASYEVKSFDTNEAFDNIKLDERVDVEILPSEDGRCRVVYCDTDEISHRVYVQSGTLTVSCSYRQKRFISFGFKSSDVYVKIYLPKGRYGALLAENTGGSILVSPGFSFGSAELKSSSGRVEFSGETENGLFVKTTSGSIRLEEISSGALEASSSSGSIFVNTASAKDVSAETTSGRIELSEIKSEGKIELHSVSGKIVLDRASCKTLYAENTSGGIDASNAVSEGAFTLETVSGAIELSSVDGGEMRMKSTSGSITGTLLSVKNFITDSSSGDIRVSDSDSSAEKCAITTTSGNIKIEVIK